jgi:hypothetical protein
MRSIITFRKYKKNINLLYNSIIRNRTQLQTIYLFFFKFLNLFENHCQNSQVNKSHQKQNHRQLCAEKDRTT